eukprot:4625483-Alexandrium_andersonii.AAC.1
MSRPQRPLAGILSSGTKRIATHVHNGFRQDKPALRPPASLTRLAGEFVSLTTSIADLPRWR